MANRLARATSPYLLQHAQNPVDWWEWEPAAFAEARRRDVPILLSVGYAACHWCHVMAHESFEDEATAAYLNEHFVSVKVDREERPDVDAVYMTATQAMTGHGGWPMTCALDHEGRPFFAGTYFPDHPRHGQPAFGQVLAALSDAWTNRGEEVRGVAGRVAEAIAASAQTAPAPVGPAEVDAAAAALVAAPDRGAPRFPPSMVLAFLLQRPADHDARALVDATCAAMARGGLYDQLGGGFARYSVDADWVVPHFEKMLYDNAQLLGVYARLGTPLGDRVARETAGFLLRELRTAEGGFASALDADSEGEEGRFYVWTPAQLTEALGEEDGAWARDVFDLPSTPGQGTFEHGTSVLQLLRDPDDAERFERVRARLHEAREQRVRPARDDKVVAAWNGLAISGLVEAGMLLDEPAYVAAAAAAGRLLLDVHLVDGRLRRVSRDGVVGAPAGVLDDHGSVASGLLALHQATGSREWLSAAKQLLDTALTHFRAPDGGFLDTADDGETLVARPRELADNASPSGQSAIAHALATYAALTGDGAYRSAAEETVAALAPVITRSPRFAGHALAAAQLMAAGPDEIAVVGRPSPGRDALAAAAWWRTGAVVVVGEPGDDHPLLAGRGEVDGRAAAYVCRGFVCERPVTDPAALGRQGYRSA